MSNISEIQKERIEKATEKYKEMEKILAPFLTPRKIINTSTEGQWQRASEENINFSIDRLFDKSTENCDPHSTPVVETKSKSPKTTSTQWVW